MGALQMNKRFWLATILFVFVIHALVAQSNIVVEPVIFKGEGEESKIPRVKDKTNANNPAVAKINNFLLGRFDLESYDPKKKEDFGYSGITFNSEVKSGILYIDYSGEYYGAGLNVVEEVLYFDLTTGEQVKNANIPFQSLFTLEGYLEFMNAHWLTAAKKAFEEAIACAESEPYCSYYDIEYYYLENSKLTVVLEDDCYARVVSYCGPGLSRSVAMDSVKGYLSQVGQKILIQDSYAAKTRIDRYLYNNQAWKTLPEHTYVFGLIDGNYPFSMAINTTVSGAVKGFYYYDKRKQKIALEGTWLNGAMRLKETVGGKVTGEFSIQWNNGYVENGLAVYDTNNNSRYVTGEWKSADGKKVMPITFTEVKFTNKKIF